MTCELRATALRWQRLARPAVVVTVLASRGSVPREAGTRMLVAADDVAGTIGGGHLELKAIANARALLAAGGPLRAAAAALRARPGLGQCCGGARRRSASPPLAGQQPRRRPEWPPSRAVHLQLYGAGHVGRAIVRLLATLVPRRLDRRARGRVPAPRRRAAAHHALRRAGRGRSGGRARRGLLPRADAQPRPRPAHHRSHPEARRLRLLGLIGSRTKRARFMHRFEQRGIAPDVLSRLIVTVRAGRTRHSHHRVPRRRGPGSSGRPAASRIAVSGWRHRTRGSHWC